MTENKQNKSSTLFVRVTPEERAEIERRAKRDYRTLSAYLRMVIREHLDGAGK